MKRVIICSIPMREYVEKTKYISNDLSLPVSDEPYRYPINSFLSQTASSEDQFKIILLIKKDGNEFYKKNTNDYKKEISDICEKTGAKADFIQIDTDFDQDKLTHELLLGKILDEIETGAHIMADITYGPKDLPIVIFSALNFAEKFLKCEIDNIVYGKAEFKDNKVVGTAICDMIPLYCLSSVMNTINCNEPDKARQMLKSLLSL